MQMSHIQCRICIPQVAISRLFTQYYVLFALSGPLLSPTNYQSKPVSQVVNSSSSKLSFFNQIIQVLALAALISRCQRLWKETPPLSRSALIYRWVGLIYVDKRSSEMEQHRPVLLALPHCFNTQWHMCLHTSLQGCNCCNATLGIRH